MTYSGRFLIDSDIVRMGSNVHCSTPPGIVKFENSKGYIKAEVVILEPGVIIEKGSSILISNQ